MLSKNEDVTQHSVDYVYETNEWHKTSVAALESYCLAHNTDSVKACSTKQNDVIYRIEVEDVERSICKSKCCCQVRSSDKNAEKAVVEENYSVGNIFERSIKHSNWCTHEASY